ncbi:MAG: hypothetical protein OEU09_13845 [Rhodospirillales bacterium]|nr:hypothetical protein [Rhodospirillales bacterium]MDH3790935.1 hypothetical protein [Rhodospirillales bacterium]MDH3912371.1 hypothetical protein [Rhodospirillales bacterium]
MATIDETCRSSRRGRQRRREVLALWAVVLTLAAVGLPLCYLLAAGPLPR